MSRDPAFEAYNGLCLAMPNGRTVTGRIIPFPTGLELLELLQIYQVTAIKKDFTKLWTQFLDATDIAPDQFDGLQIGELCDVIARFLSHRRTPSTPSSPSSSAAPSPASLPPAGG